MENTETQCLIKYEKLKFDARRSKFQFSNEYKNALIELRKDHNSVDVAQFFPSLSTARNTFNSIRRKYQSTKDTTRVKKSKDLVLSEDMKTITVDGKQQLFLQYDNHCRLGNRILIYYSDQATKIISVCTVISVDGTFKYSPEIFYQILSINALYKCDHMQCVFSYNENRI